MGDLAAEPIRTGRLTLVPLRAEHAKEMAGVLADPALYLFTGGSPPTPGELRDRYERQAAGSGRPDEIWCNWVIELREAGGLVGYVQATITGTGRPAAEIAWVVGTGWQGRGIATEAARGLVGWLRQQGAGTIVAHVHPDHHASAAVARAAGLAPADRWHDGEIRWELTTEAGWCGGRPAAGGS